jgi:ribosomal protein S12 methylthiotransferase
MGKVYLISLGCSKNKVDSEVILGILLQDGFVPAANLEEADVAIINTCAFIQEAVEESIETILDLVHKKEEGKINTLVVTGCLPQRYGEEVAREIPEVDLWVGTGEFIKIPWLLKGGGPQILIGKPSYLYDHVTPRVVTNTPHSAYVKIAEGCSHSCTFCLIPRLRGAYRSRVMDSVVREVEDLVAKGVVEVNLIAQDTTGYGMDLGEEGGLWRLLEKLIKIKELMWIRILYAYPHPNNFPLPFLDMIAEEEKICPYLDIPIQHIDDKILRRMGRRTSEIEIRELIYRIRKNYPNIHLRTTLMVGFPGEGEKEFNELIDFVKEAEFSHLGVFRYSSEEGTRAVRMKGKISSRVAEDRATQVMEMQQDIVWRKNRGMVGSVIPVLIDGVCAGQREFLQGRARFQAPEVDGVVYINSGTARCGEIIEVKVTEVGPYDLMAKTIAS